MLSFLQASAPRPRVQERRDTDRRDGRLADVLLLVLGAESEVIPAQVEDYAPGGVGLWCREALPAGTALKVGLPDGRGEAAWETTCWFPARITHVEPDLLGYVMGCAWAEPDDETALALLDGLAQDA